MNRNVRIGVSLLGLVALVALAWTWAWPSGNYNDDPQVAELERARDAVFARHEQLTEDQRRAERRALEERAKGLSPQQQWALMESSLPLIVPMAAKRFESEYDKFMELSPDEQRRELDKRIDAMEKRGPQGMGGGGGRPQLPPEKRDELRKKMLDWTTPSQRAKFENGIRMFNQRREQRGLEPVGRPGGGLF